MNANELRIGNLVDVINRRGEIHSPHGLVKRIGQIGLFEVHLYEIDKPFAIQENPLIVSISDLCEIELTEEQLLKLGFEKRCKKPFNHVEFVIKNTIDNIHERIFFNGDDWSFDSGTAKYVHSFQNLYFAITGIELNYK